MSAPKLSRAERREVARFGIHEDEARRAHAEAMWRGMQLVLASLGGLIILAILGGAVLAVAFR